MLPLNRHGRKEMLVGSVLLLALAAGLWWVWWPLALAPLPVLAWLLAFFRDPNRVVPQDLYAIVSPADGLVTDITDIAYDQNLHGPAVSVGIFLSVFNVHVNRSPCRGKVIEVLHRPGEFLSALRHADASARNESNTIVFADEVSGQPIMVVRQIAGLIARRIVCDARLGQSIDRGERIGLIKFGSRTELIIARSLAPQVVVKVGQKVRGAADTIARMGAPHGAIAKNDTAAA